MPDSAPDRFTVIAKPIIDCNLNCAYCYIPPNDEFGIMSESTLESFLFEAPSLVSENGTVTLLWHGGEPLMMGLDFYRKAIEIENEVMKTHKMKFRNTMQSNVTLVDDKIAKFVRENNIYIGTSLDGPAYLHNLTRKYPDGSGSFDDVMRGVETLRKNGMDPGAICVINKTNKDHVREIYDFFKSIGMSFKVNSLIYSERVVNQRDRLGLTSEDYYNLLKGLFDIFYFENDPTVCSDTIAYDIIMPILTGRSGLCSYSKGSCQERFIGLYPNGDMYPCGGFGGDSEFLYGNINKMSMLEILSSGKRKYLMDRWTRLIECKKCDEHELCNGGCPYEANLVYGTVDKQDPYCSSRKRILRYVRDVVIKDLKNAEVK